MGLLWNIAVEPPLEQSAGDYLRIHIAMEHHIDCRKPTLSGEVTISIVETSRNWGNHSLAYLYETVYNYRFKCIVSLYGAWYLGEIQLH